ncbi:flagellar export protein FliJ [Desulfonatronum thiodismutans]|uniref:flagellar export protein FliJ n=1 Tax=Desulfonatronum thiodismutans TaxID=159290 RepID=UPI0004ABDB1A|nr:flagellar export protein FliJ [Desulfonatronum thiodismutans]
MPKPFHFSLENVLDYRRQLVDNARLELAAAQRAYQAQTLKVEELRVKQEEAASRLESRHLLSPDEFWLWSTYRERLLQDVQREEYRLQNLANRVASCRGELIQRSKDAKILERLRNKKTLEFHAQEKSNEQKDLDEMATLRHQYKDL